VGVYRSIRSRPRRQSSSVMSVRQRYFIAASLAYVLIGIIILARGAIAHEPIAGVFGLIFVALGAVRLRDFRSWRGRTR
jgi:hypothetical protein